jgi:translin
MLNQKFWKKITKNYSDYQKGRTQIIGQSNLALNNAKKAIFALHRDNIEDSQTKLEQSKKILLNLEKKFGSNSKFRGEGSWKAAFEEFAEAALYFEYRKSGKVGKIEGIKLEFDEYLGGLADLTGELVRWAVLLINNGDYSKMHEIKNTVSEIVQILLDANLTGHLRQKFDQAKKSQQRIEQMIYDLKIRELI